MKLFWFCLVLFPVLVYAYKKVENPYVKSLLLMAAVPTFGVLFFFYLFAFDSPITPAIPSILVISYAIFKAVQWQRQKSKRKSEEEESD